MNARFLGEKPFWDTPNLRHTAPTARFGNLLVFRGTFDCGGIFALNLYFDAVSKIYAEKPDLHCRPIPTRCSRRPSDPELRRSIEEQIKRVSSDPLGQVPDLRNPFTE